MESAFFPVRSFNERPEKWIELLFDDIHTLLSIESTIVSLGIRILLNFCIEDTAPCFLLHENTISVGLSGLKKCECHSLEIDLQLPHSQFPRHGCEVTLAEHRLFGPSAPGMI